VQCSVVQEDAHRVRTALIDVSLLCEICGRGAGRRTSDEAESDPSAQTWCRDLGVEDRELAQHLLFCRALIRDVAQLLLEACTPPLLLYDMN
jgi:hypothetical protein